MRQSETTLPPLLKEIGVTEFRRLDPKTMVILWDMLCSSMFELTNKKEAMANKVMDLAIKAVRASQG